MTQNDYQLLYMYQCSQMAFMLSRFAKYGDSGKERFYPDWISSYIKAQEAEARLNLEKIFKKSLKNGVALRRSFDDLAVLFDKYLETINKYSQLSDLERIEMCIEKSSSELGIEIQTTKHESDLEEIEESDNNKNIIIIPKGTIEVLQNNNIPGNTAAPILLKSNNLNLHQQLFKNLSDHGLWFTKREQIGAFLVVYLNSAVNNNIVSELTQKAA